MGNLTNLMVALFFASFLISGGSIAMAGSPTGGFDEKSKTPTTQMKTPATPGIGGSKGEHTKQIPKDPPGVKRSKKTRYKVRVIRAKPDYELSVCRRLGIPVPGAKEITDCTVSDKNIAECAGGTKEVVVHCLKPGKVRVTIKYKDPMGNRTLHKTVLCK